MTIALRYPAWSGKPEITVNGKRVKVSAKPSSYIDIRRHWKAGDVIEARFPMSLRVETAPDNDRRGVLMYGPVLLVGNLGTEGIVAPAPFSDPTVRNDYYTYDYKIPAGLNTTLAVDPRNPTKTIRRTGSDLRFRTSAGQEILPLYDANRIRYVVYWDL